MEMLQALVDAFNAHDLDAIMAMFAEDCVLETPRGPSPFGGRFDGRPAVREGLASRFTGIPDVHYGDPIHFVCGNTGISKWRLTGTTVTGQKIDLQGCDFFSFRDGKVTKKDSYWKIVDA